jgi:hypothetical protein
VPKRVVQYRNSRKWWCVYRNTTSVDLQLGPFLRKTDLLLFICPSPKRNRRNHVENYYRRGEFVESLLHLLPFGVASMCHCGMTSPALSASSPAHWISLLVASRSEITAQCPKYEIASACMLQLCTFASYFCLIPKL